MGSREPNTDSTDALAEFERKSMKYFIAFFGISLGVYLGLSLALVAALFY